MFSELVIDTGTGFNDKRVPATFKICEGWRAVGYVENVAHVQYCIFSFKLVKPKISLKVS